MYISNVHEKTFILISQISFPGEFDLQHLNQLMDGVSWINGNNVILLKCFPFPLLVEEKDYW